MDNTQLVSLSYQLAAYRSMDVIANNLANASTPGYKSESTKFEEFVAQARPAEGENGTQPISFVHDTGTIRDLSQGAMTTTSDQFDLAIGGKGYFVVQSPDGAQHYTRDGHFSLDSSGRLVNSSGYPLQGDGGEITVSTEDGDIHVGRDGIVTGAKGQLGKVKVVNFPDERALVREGANLFTTTQPATEVDKPNVEQGMLESSNVQPVAEISTMLQLMRTYQMTANLSQAQQQLTTNAIDKISATPN